MFDAAEQVQHTAAAITKLGITGADPREDVEWKQTGLEPHVKMTRPISCPPLVTLANIVDVIKSARRDEIVLGIGRRGITAPPPGGRVPSWVNVPIMPPRPLGQLPVPDIADLASLAMRRLWECLEAGEASVSPQDAAALIRLAREIERG